MAMTKKDYETIAKVFVDFKEELELMQEPYKSKGRLAADILAADMADALFKANPRFDRIRFQKACGF